MSLSHPGNGKAICQELWGVPRSCAPQRGHGPPALLCGTLPSKPKG